jgi:hypothetical protein
MDKCQLNLTYGKNKKRGKKERREGMAAHPPSLLGWLVATPYVHLLLGFLMEIVTQVRRLH